MQVYIEICYENRILRIKFTNQKFPSHRKIASRFPKSADGASDCGFAKMFGGEMVQVYRKT